MKFSVTSIKSILASMRRFIGNRRAAPRFRSEVVAQLLLLPNQSEGVHSDRGRDQAAPVLGKTLNLSETGMAILIQEQILAPVLPIQIRHHLRIKLELPTGLVELEAIVARTLQLEQVGLGHMLLIGAHIVEISELAKIRYVSYLRLLKESPKNSTFMHQRKPGSPC